MSATYRSGADVAECVRSAEGGPLSTVFEKRLSGELPCAKVWPRKEPGIERLRELAARLKL